jgi:hypothetical protein
MRLRITVQQDEGRTAAAEPRKYIRAPRPEAPAFEPRKKLW